MRIRWHGQSAYTLTGAITGAAQVVRSTAGRFQTPVGEVVAIASEHDAEAGTVTTAGTEHAIAQDGVGSTGVLHMAPPAPGS